jgi:hypothetical protein
MDMSDSESDVDQRPAAQELFANLKRGLPDLKALLEKCSSHWGYEDPVYRFYHHSFKVYRLQETTAEIVKALQALAPGRELHDEFMRIVREGTGKAFALEHNTVWMETTRPILEAFFHARFFLEMAVRYGEGLESPPNLLPSGWAALLYLYDLR